MSSVLHSLICLAFGTLCRGWHLTHKHQLLLQGYNIAFLKRTVGSFTGYLWVANSHSSITLSLYWVVLFLQRNRDEVKEEYGSKLHALIKEYQDTRAADPTAKFVIFSSWGRLLKLASRCLTTQHIEHATLVGTCGSERQKQLDKFLYTVNCTCLLVLMTTAGEIRYLWGFEGQLVLTLLGTNWEFNICIS